MLAPSRAQLSFLSAIDLLGLPRKKELTQPPKPRYDHPMNTFDATILAFAVRVQEMVNEHTAENFPSLTPETISIDPNGRKYVRIVRSGDSSRSVYCFVERETGNILKAASWKTPAKGARGNIYADDHGMQAVTAYGAVYRR